VGGWTVGMEAKTSAFVSPAVIAPKQVDGGGGGEDAVGARACGNKAEKYSKQQDTCHRLAGKGSSTPTVLVT